MKTATVDVKYTSYKDKPVFWVKPEKDGDTFENFSGVLCEDRKALYPILVYGTLKKGFFNNKRCEMHKHPCLGTAFSQERIFDFWSMQGVYPAVVPVEDNQFRVGGELYLVDEEKLFFLDIMENNYHRVCIPIQMKTETSNNKHLTHKLEWAWLYMLTPDNKDSNYWTKDDDQIKLVDKKSKIKIWGGSWAKEDTYKKGKIFRNQNEYMFPTDTSLGNF